MARPLPVPISEADAWLSILPDEGEAIEEYVARYRDLSPQERWAAQAGLIRSMLAFAGD